jgi:hypothetical protein
VEVDYGPRKESNAVKGLIAGAVAGLVATWAMTEFQTYLKKQVQEEKKGKKKRGIAATVKVAGPAVPYAFGTLMGAAYGVTAELAPGARSGVGVPFGAGLWLAKPPQSHPVSTHASALAAHVVYGFGVELVRRVVRCMLG